MNNPVCSGGLGFGGSPSNCGCEGYGGGGWLDYGDFILLRGTDGKDGMYQVRDSMNARFVNRIDILESPGTKPYKFTSAQIVKTTNFVAGEGSN